jgi:molybdenum cofactor guanylyltransferase
MSNPYAFTDRPHTPAVILAGGLATRMGGGDKGLRLVAGKRLIDIVIARLAPQCQPLAINANGDAGPLAGVLAGMDWAASLGADHVLTVAADTPFFPTDLALKLRQAGQETGLALAASPDAEGKIWQHPTFGIWPTALRDDLRAALNLGLRKIVLWTQKHGAGQAVFSNDPFDPFFNINSPEDVITAEKLATLI